jgi:hypothetical protein
MRFLAFLLIVSCSTQVPLKYKYSSPSREVAGEIEPETEVSKIEGELRNPLIFASGMDSTFLSVKLYDSEGNQLTNIDPDDLTLSTNVDIEAKPFVIKQGVYKAEILPRVKSKSITMRVDWQEKVLSQEIFLRTTVAPLKNELVPLNHDFFQSRSLGEISVTRGSATPESFTDGFSIQNVGDNKIVQSSIHKNSERVFNFDYLEQARQNLSLEVYDTPNEYVSHTMHSYFMFFPRKNIPIVEELTGTINVTLPTGEKIIFQKESKEIVDGVFTEGPVDVSTDRFKRQYPDLKYTGKGVLLRANARGQSPQLGQYENIKIDMDYGLRGSLDVLIINGTTGQKCRRPKADFWEPIDVNPIEFKFPTDEEFEHYLKKNCGFGLPKL